MSSEIKKMTPVNENLLLRFGEEELVSMRVRTRPNAVEAVVEGAGRHRIHLGRSSSRAFPALDIDNRKRNALLLGQL